MKETLLTLKLLKKKRLLNKRKNNSGRICNLYNNLTKEKLFIVLKEEIKHLNISFVHGSRNGLSNYKILLTDFYTVFRVAVKNIAVKNN